MIASFAERQKILTVRPSSPKIILEKEVNGNDTANGLPIQDRNDEVFIFFIF
jgi:hypothetical protein